MTRESTWWFISDLHLDPGDPEGECVAEAVLRFAVDLLAPDPSAERHLVLLGDTFDLDEPGAVPGRLDAPALARLRQIARRFPAFVAAVRHCLAAGVAVHVVCGNHDESLMRLPLRRTLVEMAGEIPGGQHLRIHPWLVHRPGLFYAEHGNQHHPLHRSPLLLAGLAGPGGEAEVPGPTALEAWYARGEGGRVHAAGRLYRAVRATRSAERRAAEPAYRERVRAAAARERIDAFSALDLHDVSGFTVLGGAGTCARQVLWRRFGRAEHDSYLRHAAERIDQVLASRGERPVCYVFGHTHEPRLLTLAASGAHYANAGTWSARLLAGAGRDPGELPYVVVGEGAGGKRVRLAHLEALR